MAKSQEPIHLDGTTLEGGGQLLRLSLSLSSITRAPLHITDIRGKRGHRSKPGSAGGIKPAHFACVSFLAAATNAKTQGMELKGTDLLFRPAKREDMLEEALDTEAMPLNPVWKDVVETGVLVRRDAHISMSSPGSILLILQAILPYIFFSSSLHSEKGPGQTEPEAIPVRLIIEGGTNVWHSLSYEYAAQVLFPMLHEKLGLGPIVMKLHHRGWSTGRAEIGSLTFDIVPLRPGRTLPAFSFTDRGALTKIHVSLFASTPTARSLIKDHVYHQLLSQYPSISILFPVSEDSKHRSRMYLLLVAETSNGYRLGRDWLFDEKIADDKIEKAVVKLVTKVVRDLGNELAHGGCVDEFLQDQLVVFQALAEGKSKVEGGKASLHTETAWWVAEQILGVRFKTGNCHGIGFRAGDTHWPISPADGVTQVTHGVEGLKAGA